MIYDYPEPGEHTTHQAKLMKLLQLIRSGFVPYQPLPVSLPDEPILNSVNEWPMLFSKDGLEAGWVGYPDAALIEELLVRGMLSWRVTPLNRSWKVRRYELAERT